MERRSHNHGLDPSCNEHPTGDCIIQELLDRLENAERDLAAVTVSRDGWQTRAESAEKAMAAVRELHAASPCEPDCCLLDTCNECLNTHPCPTITALDGVPNA